MTSSQDDLLTEQGEDDEEPPKLVLLSSQVVSQPSSRPGEGDADLSETKSGSSNPIPTDKIVPVTIITGFLGSGMV